MSLKKADRYVKKAKLEIYKAERDTKVSSRALKHLNFAENELPEFEENNRRYDLKARQLNKIFTGGI